MFLSSPKSKNRFIKIKLRPKDFNFTDNWLLQFRRISTDLPEIENSINKPRISIFSELGNKIRWI